MIVLYSLFLIVPILLNIFAHCWESPKIGFCVFKVIAGFDCPFCGLTRSISSTILTHYNNAFNYHSLGIFITMYFIIVVSYFIISIICKKIFNLEWRIETRILSLLNKIILFIALGGYFIKRII